MPILRLSAFKQLCSTAHVLVFQETYKSSFCECVQSWTRGRKGLALKILGGIVIVVVIFVIGYAVGFAIHSQPSDKTVNENEPVTTFQPQATAIISTIRHTTAEIASSSQATSEAESSGLTNLNF